MEPVLSRRQHVVVVGGGAVGCSTAYLLARTGFAVTLLERDRVAAHASGKNAGNLNPVCGALPALIPLTLAAFRLHAGVYAELRQLGFANYSITPLKRLHLAFDATDLQHLEQTAECFKRTKGFSSAWIERDDLGRIVPAIPPEAKVGLLTEGNATLDGEDFCRSLATAAQHLGARVLQETALGIHSAGDRVTAIQAGGGLVACDEVVFATGPWVADTASWLGCCVPVKPLKGEMLLIQMPNGMPPCDVTWGSTSLYRRRQNELWVGVTMTDCGFDCRPTEEARKQLLDRAERMMPGIRNAPLLWHTAALRPMTRSGAPIACRAEGWRNVFIANGGGFKGILLSLAIARDICDLLLNVERGESITPSLD